MESRPDYKRIYKDIIRMKHPDKENACASILSKKNLSFIDMIELNQIIFNGKSDLEIQRFNQKHRSYSKEDIVNILDYQKKNRLNNSQLANHFKMSRNTITKWRKLFIV